MMHLDARHPQVIVPAYLKDDMHLRLNLSYRFDVPDLDIDEARIQVTLSFQGTPFLCVIPLDSIWGISQPPAPGLHLFPDAIPQEIAFQLVGEQFFSEEEAAAMRSILNVRSHLAEEDEDDDEEELSERARETPTPGLRLVVDNSDAPIEESDPDPISHEERRALFHVVPSPAEDEDEDDQPEDKDTPPPILDDGDDIA